MARKQQFRIAPTNWLRPADFWVEHTADDSSQLVWPDSDNGVSVLPATDQLLDAFVQLRHEREPSWDARWLLSFVERWGTWGFCACGRVHPAPPNWGGNVEIGFRQIAVPTLSVAEGRVRTPTGLCRDDIATLRQTAERVNAFRLLASPEHHGLEHGEVLWAWLRGSPGDGEATVQQLAWILNAWTLEAHLTPRVLVGRPSSQVEPWEDGRVRSPGAGVPRETVIAPGGLASAVIWELHEELAMLRRVRRCRACGTSFRVKRIDAGSTRPIRDTDRSRCPSCVDQVGHEARKTTEGNKAVRHEDRDDQT